MHVALHVCMPNTMKDPENVNQFGIPYQLPSFYKREVVRKSEAGKHIHRVFIFLKTTEANIPSSEIRQQYRELQNEAIQQNAQAVKALRHAALLN